MGRDDSFKQMGSEFCDIRILGYVKAIGALNFVI